jgi:hypothetical protein
MRETSSTLPSGCLGEFFFYQILRILAATGTINQRISGGGHRATLRALYEKSFSISNHSQTVWRVIKYSISILCLMRARVILVFYFLLARNPEYKSAIFDDRLDKLLEGSISLKSLFLAYRKDLEGFLELL